MSNYVPKIYMGTPVVQLDYETGEYIDEYPSISAIAKDYNIALSYALRVFRNSNCCMVKLPKHQLLFMKKESYERMMKINIDDEMECDL